jgi:hypothetical protein
LNVRKVLDAIAFNWQLKLTALGIALLLWLVVQSGKPYRYRMSQVPVKVVNQDGDWIVARPPSPSTVSIEFYGRFRDLLELASSGVSVLVPVEDVQDTIAVYALHRGSVDLGTASRDITVGSIRPDSVYVTFDRMATRLAEVYAPLTGTPPAGYELAGALITDPSVVRVSGPSRRLARMDTITLPPIDIGRITGYDTTEITIDTVGTGVMVSPRRVRVIVPMHPMPPAVPGGAQPGGAGADSTNASAAGAR